jgi:hypothetical protein
MLAGTKRKQAARNQKPPVMLGRNGETHMIVGDALLVP